MHQDNYGIRPIFYGELIPQPNFHHGPGKIWRAIESVGRDSSRDQESDHARVQSSTHNHHEIRA